MGRNLRQAAGRKGLRRASPGPARRGRRQGAYQARLPAQLRADGRRQHAAQDRAAGQEDGGGRRPRRAVRQGPQRLGRPGDLGHDQAVLERLHVGLFPQRRRCEARRNRHRGAARERTDLHFPVRTHITAERRHHGRLPADRLSGRLPAGHAADAHLEHADDPGAAAVLDVAAGSDLRLEGAAPAAGRHQRHAGFPGPRRR